MRLSSILATVIFVIAAGAQASVNSSPAVSSQAGQSQDAADAYARALVYGGANSLTLVNRTRALAWLRKAAALGHGEAQYRLAAVYERGAYGVPRDAIRAAAWLERSAQQGFAEAQYALGMRYAEGRGVPRNPLAALAWILRAARSGHPEAVQALSRGAKGKFLHR